MAVEDPRFHYAWETWGHLETRDVRVCLSTGSTLSGRLLAIDPESGAVVLVAPASGLLSLALGHAVTSVTPAAAAAPSSAAAAATAQRVLRGVAPAPAPAASPAGDGAALVLALQRMRLPVAEERDGDGRVSAVRLLGGAARVRAPFREEDCEAANETVLARVQEIVRRHAGGGGREGAEDWEEKGRSPK